MWINVLFVIMLTGILYRYFTTKNNYWKRRNVPYAKPMPLFGNFYEVVTMKKGLGFFLADLYNQIKAPYFGIWVFTKPYLIIKSPDLVKSILLTDFDHFSNRTVHSGEHIDDVLAKMIFFQRNPAWRITRKRLTPAFSSGKLRAMVPLMNDCAGDMINFVEQEIKVSENIECKAITSKYMVSVITSCFFGLREKTFHENGNKFSDVGLKMFQMDLSNAVRGASYFFVPSLVDMFKISFVKPEVTSFLVDVFTKVVEEREQSNVKRNDLVDILLQFKKEEMKRLNSTPDISDIIANALQIYLAGFETTSSTTSFTLYELCLNRDYQNKLRKEIFASIEKNGGLTYEAVMDMKFLNNCILETVRKYPVLPFLDRRCEKDYKIPGSEVVIEKGTPVFIPLFGLHYDPEYFPNPKKYDPDRFTEENSKNRHNYCYLPFGEGPHYCIGARFGQLAVKLALINILSNFEVLRNNNTPVPIVFNPKSLTLQSEVGLPMSFIKYNNI